MQRLDETRIFRIVAQGLPQFLDAAVQTVVEIDKYISGPELLP